MIRVYFNLHKNLYSIQKKNDKGNWIVNEYRREINLKNVEFKVSEVGRQRVLREKRKNVHAYVIGEIFEGELPQELESRRVRYNPYKFNFFVIDSGQSIFKADLVVMKMDGNEPIIEVKYS